MNTLYKIKQAQKKLQKNNIDNFKKTLLNNTYETIDDELKTKIDNYAEKYLRSPKKVFLSLQKDAKNNGDLYAKFSIDSTKQNCSEDVINKSLSLLIETEVEKKYVYINKKQKIISESNNGQKETDFYIKKFDLYGTTKWTENQGGSQDYVVQDVVKSLENGVKIAILEGEYWTFNRPKKFNGSAKDYLRKKFPNAHIGTTEEVAQML
jgi:hypothetical protein